MTTLATRDQHPSWMEDPEHGVVPSRPRNKNRWYKRYHAKNVFYVIVLVVTLITGAILDRLPGSGPLPSLGWALIITSGSILVGWTITSVQEGIQKRRSRRSN